MNAQTGNEIKRRNDHAAKDFYREANLMGRHKTQTIKEVNLLKAAAYRAAKFFVEMFDRDVNWLRQHCQTQSCTVDAWCDKYFEPLRWIGEDWRDLVELVRRGVAVQDYLTTRGVAIVSTLRRREVEKKISERAVPPVPDVNIPAEQQAQQLRGCVEALEENLRSLRLENSRLKKEVAVLRSTIDRITKSLKAASA